MKQPIPFVIPRLSFGATVASAFVFYAYLIRQFTAGKRHVACRFNYKNNISFTDLIEKALRKLAGQALKNEIDVTNASSYS